MTCPSADHDKIVFVGSTLCGSIFGGIKEAPSFRLPVADWGCGAFLRRMWPAGLKNGPFFSLHGELVN